MGRKKRIAVVGIPKFSKRLSTQLSSFFPAAVFKSFDTYYKFADKIAAIPFIFTADTVYSINGSLIKSGIFDLTLCLKKRLVMHWVGTDVLKSTDAFRSGKYNQRYLEGAVHLCEVDWIQRELAEIGIDAEIQNFFVFKKEMAASPGVEQFNVLSYLHPERERFYGIEALIECAEHFPDVPFYLTGTSGYDRTTPENMIFFGWVNNLPEMIAKAGICIRYPQHDGLSSFVLESLACGKYVAYSYAFPHCIHCKSSDDLIRAISEKKNAFEKGELGLNQAAKTYIREEFDEEKVFNQLLRKLSVV